MAGTYHALEPITLPVFKRAACRGEPIRLFVPDEHERFDPEPARRICLAGGPGGRPCPDGKVCLRWALANPAEVGVWGATTAQERDNMRAGKPLNAPSRRHRPDLGPCKRTGCERHLHSAQMFWQRLGYCSHDCLRLTYLPETGEAS